MPQQITRPPWTILATVLLVMATCNASALQMGPINVHSRIGEPLNASVGLWLNLKDKSEALGLKISPDLSYIANSRLTEIVNRMEARLAYAPNGNAYVQITTNGNVAEPIVAFRLKVSVGTSAVMRNFSLALSPAPRILPVEKSQPRTQEKLTRQQTTQKTEPIRGSSYVVAKGDSLWGIARRVAESNPGKIADLVDQIFADNPQAFVNGDRNKLKLGEHLTLPTALTENLAPRLATAEPAVESVASTVQAPISTPAAVVPATRQQTTPIITRKVTVDWRERKPEVAAELAALKEKFAALKARYGDQVAASESPKQSTTLAPVIEPPPVSLQESVNSPSVPVAATPKIQSEPPIDRSTQSTSDAAQTVTNGDTDMAADSSALYAYLSSGTFQMALVILLGLTALVITGYLARKELQSLGRRRAESKYKQQELNRREEVARKAKTRVEMESEVKRLLAENDRLATNNGAQGAEVGEQEINITGQSAENKDADIDLNIAHGRYDEAENSLLQVIAAAPRNYSAKLRLIEVYYMTERVSEFCALADELQASHRADMSDEEWRRVVRMGKIIAPDEVRFSGPRAVGNSPSSA